MLLSNVSYADVGDKKQLEKREKAFEKKEFKEWIRREEQEEGKKPDKKTKIKKTDKRQLGSNAVIL